MLSPSFKSVKNARLLFATSLLVIAFYFIGYIVLGDVYKYGAVGAIYEFLWLPMLLCLVVIPAVGVLMMINNNGKSRVYAALAILSIIGAISILVNQ